MNGNIIINLIIIDVIKKNYYYILIIFNYSTAEKKVSNYVHAS